MTKEKFFLGLYMIVFAAGAITIQVISISTSAAIYVMSTYQGPKTAIVRKVPGAIIQKKSVVSRAPISCAPQYTQAGPIVGGLSGVDIPKLPKALRTNYDNLGTSQYSVPAFEREIFNYYIPQMASQCWELNAISPSSISWRKDDQVLQIEVKELAVGDKSLVDYRLSSTGVVLGESYRATTEGMACPQDQIRCYGMNDSVGWCQMPPCPTTSGGTTACTADQVRCYGMNDSVGWCQMPPCPTTSGGTTGGTMTCTSSYSQGTINTCNWSMCPSGCTYDSQGCATGCTTTTGGGTTACTADQVRCYGMNDSVGWCQNPPCPSSTGSSSSCPSGQYWCPGTSSCKPTSDTYCPPSATSGWYPDESSCLSAGGRWCQKGTSMAHCHGPSDPAPCEDTMGGGSCPSGQVWCTSSTGTGGGWCQMSPCPSSTGGYSTTCSSGQYWCPSTASCKPTSDTNCPASGGYTSCPSGQYMCNNACVANGTSCNNYPYYPPGSTTQCTSDKYFCPSSNTCIPMGSPCGTTGTQTGTQCQSGFYWCPQTNSCISNSQTCGSTAVQPQTPTVTCGQCQVSQNGQCVKAPAGTKDPNCGTGGVCDKYGGCIKLGSGQTIVGNGAICGNGWCDEKDGENRENCPKECSNAPQPGTTPTPYPMPYPTQGGGFCGNKICEQGENSSNCHDDCGGGPTRPGGQGEQWGPDGMGPGGPSEEEMQRMDEQRFQQMKKGLSQFTRGVDQMKKMVTRMEKKLKQMGVAVPPELKAALDKAPEIVSRIKNAKTPDELEDIIADVEDIGMVMQEWGPRFGDLMRLGGMLKQGDRELKKVRSTVKRVSGYGKGNPTIQELIDELRVMANSLAETLKNAKRMALASDTPSLPVLPVPKFRRGDFNADGAIDVTDTLFFSNILSADAERPCQDAIDVNDDGTIDVSDSVYFTEWQTQGGPEPKGPGPNTIGPDPTSDSLGCDQYPKGTTFTATTPLVVLSDPGSALDMLDDDFFGRMEEFWNQVNLIEMMKNMKKGVSEAERGVKQAERTITQLKKKKVDQDVIEELQDILDETKERLKEFKDLMKQKGVDPEDIRAVGEELWDLKIRFENALAEVGYGVYQPNVKGGENVNFVMPEGFMGGGPSMGPGGPGEMGPGGPGGFGPSEPMGPGGFGGF